MFETSDLLKSYIQGLRSLSGAGAVSLFVPAPLSGIARPMLIHDGRLEPVPELADLDTALAFAAAAGPGGGADEAPIRDSRDGDAGLVPLPSIRGLWAGDLLSAGIFAEQQPLRRRSDEKAPNGDDVPAAWLGFRFPPGQGSLIDRLRVGSLPRALAHEDDPSRWWDWLFSLGGALASHTSQVSAILEDPITGLADRIGFQAVLSEELEKARLSRSRLALLLINPDEFAPINERFGREAGDAIIRDISNRLTGVLRSSDPVARYGGVIFAAILADSANGAARSVAEKILQRLTEGAFLDGAVRLGFSIGIAAFDPADPDIKHGLDLIRRADQALNAAKRLGGGCIIDWEERSGVEETGAFDRLSGIFTGNMAKDYRNMVLLWDTVDVIALNREFEPLAGEVVERLYATFKPNRLGILIPNDDSGLDVVRGLTRRGGGGQQRVAALELTPAQENLVKLAIAAGEPREQSFAGAGGDDGDSQAYAVPLGAGGEALGALYLDGSPEALALESSDLVFLRALAKQLTVALDRARLFEAEGKRQESERRRLRAELNELRQAIHQSKLVYRSAEIESLVATARRVAPTDATILITGESGTGKELLARTVHELSRRKDEPFVIVDCGAIATTLIESELFGHEKGAYTGAQARRIGRLAEANHGTVLLDEIGELPLEVQSKLLRFVQEKQFTTVGGTRPRRVDVRILAATNRDLAAEVAAGTFREDLYHRLNVVRLEVPPLRGRPDDILHLARHFLETFSVRYHKSVRRFSSAAEQLLVSYSWPGNVRELQNRIMQAVILAEGDEVDAAQLGVAADGTGSRAATLPSSALEPRAVAPSGPAIDLWERLRAALAREIDLALTGNGHAAFPLGKWLSEDFVLEANELAAGVARKAAASVGMPETTFRRRLARASQMAAAGLSPRSDTWEDVRRVVTSLLRSEAEGTPLVERASRILLQEIVARVPGDTRRGSTLLGVTPPTFRSRLGHLGPAG